MPNGKKTLSHEFRENVEVGYKISGNDPRSWKQQQRITSQASKNGDGNAIYSEKKHINKVEQNIRFDQFWLVR